MPSALIVEDDRNSRDALAEWAGREGFEVTTAGTLEDARKHLEKNSVHVVIIDLMLPDGQGTDLVQELESIPNVEVLIITGHGTVDSAVTALKGGAIDYLTKPIDLGRLQKNLAHIREKSELREEVVELRGELRRLGRFGSMIGASQPMQSVYDLIGRVAPTDATVLITGETGTGKELVARSVHELSTRSRKAFLPVNCGAVSPSLIESELFGHERGSFTGADRQRKGVFERAHGGTLFLDEITEMPAELQVKLLRVLETGVVTRVGGEDSGRIDVRVIGATNRNPEEAVENGRLRRDLLYRLNVFPVALDGGHGEAAQPFLAGERARAQERGRAGLHHRPAAHRCGAHPRRAQHAFRARRGLVQRRGRNLGRRSRAAPDPRDPRPVPRGQEGRRQGAGRQPEDPLQQDQDLRPAVIR
jgi:DNA-binding NtrC family response regulator